MEAKSGGMKAVGQEKEDENVEGNTLEYSNQSVRLTSLLFLRGVAMSYFFALLSIFWELPGTFLRTGLLPAAPYLERMGAHLGGDLMSKMQRSPTLLWLVYTSRDEGPIIGMSVDVAFTVLVVAGLFISLFIMFLPGHGSSYTVGLTYRVMFLLLWACYLSVFQVGQDFLTFQWDILLLEIGFLCIFITPVDGTQTTSEIGMVLLRWFFFRFMYASGVVKLRSECPTWWGLTALNYHYETTCIPAAGSWLFHQFPDVFQQLSVLMTYLIECVLPFLFLLPSRRCRLVSGFAQLLLMVLIAMTGNYNFFNFLTCVIALCCFDDDFLRMFLPRNWSYKAIGLDPKRKVVNPNVPNIMKTLQLLFDLFVLIAVVGFSFNNVLISWAPRSAWNDVTQISFKLAFNKSQFAKFIKYSLIGGFGLLAIHLFTNLLWSIVHHYKKGFFGIVRLVTTVLILGFECMVLSVSFIPFLQQLDSRSGFTQLIIPPQVHKFHQMTKPFRLTSSYGLFARMTTERREIIYEGTSENHPSKNGWKEYKFRFKPQALDEAPPYISPHQPRLDWQMWFAALRDYQSYPFTVHLAAKLLNNSTEVNNLLDPSQNPFLKEPPKHVRAVSYLYKFTKINKFPESRTDLPKNYWRRSDMKIYIPPLSITEPTLNNFLKHYGWDKTFGKEAEDSIFLEVSQKVRWIVEPLMWSSGSVPLALWICLVCYSFDMRRFRETRKKIKKD